MKHIILALACVPLFAACKASDIPLKPDEQAEVAVLKAEIEERDARLVKLETEAKTHLAAAEAAAKAADKEAFDLAAAELTANVEEYEETLDARREAADAETAIYKAAQDRGTQGFLGMIAPFIPAPLQPFVPFGSALAGMLFLDRPRKHLIAGVKGAAKLQVGQTLASLAKAAGWSHSTATTKKVADEEMAAPPGNAPNPG